MRPHHQHPQQRYSAYDQGGYYSVEDQHLIHQLPSFNYPLRGIPHPHAHDVLCGRGGQSNTHPGNLQWRTLVAANKELYVSLPKKQKMLLSQSIVNAVRSQTPPGRFLQKDPSSEQWYDVGDKRAQEKTSQALREGAPEIRSKLKGKKGGKAKDEEEDESDDVKPPEVTSIERNTSREQMPPPVKSISSDAASDRKPAFIEKKKEEDETPPPPPPSSEAEFSFGSIALMSDAEQARLMNVPQPPPVDSGLDQPGFSFGSMMSIGTATAPGQKLERAGLSVGSMMSYTVADSNARMNGSQHHKREDSFGAAPDLHDIGTSFGSLSINPGERAQIIQEAQDEMVAAAVPPTYLKAQKSTGDLLECSDSDSEDETDLVAQKSANWERLQATIAAQDMRRQPSTSIPLPSNMYMPGNEPPMVNIPTTDVVSRNFSNMSAISVAEDFEPLHHYPTQPSYGGGGYYNQHEYSHPAPEIPMPPPMKKGSNDSCWADVQSRFDNNAYGR